MLEDVKVLCEAVCVKQLPSALWCLFSFAGGISLVEVFISYNILLQRTLNIAKLSFRTCILMS